MSTPIYSFGAFTDLHKPPNNSTISAFNVLKRCSEILNNIKLNFVIQLGDIIACNELDIKLLCASLDNFGAPLYNVLGNHDFDITHSKRKTLFNYLFPQGTYYDFSPSTGWRCIVLDGTEISLFRYMQNSKNYKEALSLLDKLKSQKAGRAFEWNGAIATGQLKWLSERLSASEESGEKVLIFCHFPCFPSDELFSLLNANDIIEIIESHNCVSAYISGHQHPGFYFHKKGVHYLSLKSIDYENTPNCAVIEIHSHGIRVTGFNRQNSLILSF